MAALLQKATFKKNSGRDHFLMCQAWWCLTWWHHPHSIKLLPKDFDLKSLQEITVGAHAYFRTSDEDCARWGHLLDFCTGIKYYKHRWELVRCTVVVPFLSHKPIETMQSFEEWDNRPTMISYRTNHRNFAHGSTEVCDESLAVSFCGVCHQLNLLGIC
jgi:hypothetical protein